MDRKSAGIRIYRNGLETGRGGRENPSVSALLCSFFCTFVLASAWWNALISVFGFAFRSGWVYAGTGAVCAVLVILHRLLGKKTLVLAAAAAGILLWICRDAAAELISAAAAQTAEGLKAVSGGSTYPGASGGETGGAAKLAAVFLTVPFLELWILALQEKRARAAAVLAALVPFIAGACAGHFPAVRASWALLLAIGAYAVCCGAELCLTSGTTGKRKELQVFFTLGALCILAGVSAFAGRALDSGRETEGSFYQTARGRIREDVIGRVEETVQSLQGREETEPEDQEQGTREQESEDRRAPASEETAGNGDRTGVLEAPGAGFRSGSSMEDLGSLRYFSPDDSVSGEIVLPEKPAGTVYLPERVGVAYADNAWRGPEESYDYSSQILMGMPEGHWEDIVPEGCLAYPGSLEQLQELCSGWDPDSLQAAAQEIDRALSERAVYDTEPGAVPSGQDFAEYFLFENHRGFCVHFATAAVLLYRMCGYPARYAEGFAIPASAFTADQDGQYAAQIDGSMGHAWCQVYDENSGEWLDMEHTPAAGTGGNGADEPEAEGQETENQGSGGRIGLPGEGEGAGLFSRAAVRVILRVLCAAAVLASALAAFLLQAGIRTRRRHRRMRRRAKGTGTLEIYAAVCRTWAFQNGRTRRGEPLDAGTLEGLKEAYPEIPPEDWDWMYERVLEAMFYQPDGKRETAARMYQLYGTFVRAAEAGMGRCKRIIWKYILCLG